MVYMGGTRIAKSSAAQNRPTCGGPKKAGIGKQIGWFMPSMPNWTRTVNTVANAKCVNNITHPTQKYGYHATHTGRMG